MKTLFNFLPFCPKITEVRGSEKVSWILQQYFTPLISKWWWKNWWWACDAIGHAHFCESALEGLLWCTLGPFPSLRLSQRHSLFPSLGLAMQNESFVACQVAWWAAAVPGCMSVWWFAKEKKVCRTHHTPTSSNWLNFFRPLYGWE